MTEEERRQSLHQLEVDGRSTTGMASKTREKESALGEQDFKQYLWSSAVSRWRQKSRNTGLHICMGWVVWLGDREQERKIGNEELCEGKAVAGPVTRGAERGYLCSMRISPLETLAVEETLSR